MLLLEWSYLDEVRSTLATSDVFVIYMLCLDGCLVSFYIGLFVLSVHCDVCTANFSHKTRKTLGIDFLFAQFRL